MADCKNLLAHVAYGKVSATDNSNLLPSFLSFIPLPLTVASGLREACPVSSILLSKCKVFHCSIVYPLSKDKDDFHTMFTLNLSCANLTKTDTCLKYSLLRGLSNEFTSN
jgi:hypothetical protein